MTKKKIVLTGITASPGSARGKVKIVKTLKNILNVNKKEIIVASFLIPELGNSEFLILQALGRQPKD